MNRLTWALLAIAVVFGYFAYVWVNGGESVMLGAPGKPFEKQEVKTEIPPIPKLPDPAVPSVPAAPATLPAVVPGVGINPNPGVYPPGWGPCRENAYGPYGAFGWGCPIK